MTGDPNSEDTAAGNPDSLQNDADTAEKYRNPRATRKGPDMPEDRDGYRVDPDDDYPKLDGSQR